ncbi:potassium channel KAT1 [Senna tora]|uniref:Potassium channel KAT1 n=1 Tax=Senna tora TaxID=362788 RepID=A0A835CIK8_9FABA|nr:potassium channel KAT1 [Senna tora]
MLLVVLVIYSAWICPFEFAFLTAKKDALFIIDNVIDGLFAIDIVLNFFVAYLDNHSYLLIDDHKRIAIRYISTWFIFDVCSTAPFQSISLLFTNYSSELCFELLNMLRLWRLRRVSSLFARLEKDIRFNYFWTRCTKLIAVTLFAVHCAGCFYYLMAEKYPDSEKTWIGAMYPNFRERETVRAASEFASRNHLPRHIQDQMLSHLCLRFKTEGLKQQETLNGLPKAIRSSIANHLFFPVVKEAYLFHGVSHDFLFQLVSEMEAEYFPPKEDVILQNESPTDLYVLVSGAVVSIRCLLNEGIHMPSDIPDASSVMLSVWMKDLICYMDGHDQVLGKSISGETFGEIGVLFYRPQPYTVRTTELSQILRLSRTSLMSAVQAYPADSQIIMDNLFKRLKGQEGMNSEYPHADPGMVLQEKLDRGKTKESFFHVRTNNSPEDPLFQEGRRYRDLTDSEVQLNKMTTEDSERDIHSAAFKGYQEMVDILLERDANARNPNFIGWTPKTLVEQQDKESTANLLINHENGGKLDEYRIELETPEILNRIRKDATQNRRHNDPRSINCPLENVYKNSYSSNPKCPSNREVARCTKKRVTIHLLGQCRSTSKGQNGKLIILPGSIEELLKIADEKFGGSKPTKVINTENAEIDDISVIRDGDHLFLNCSNNGNLLS